MEAAELLESLWRIGEVRFNARTAGATGWNGNGSGSVAVATPDSGVLVFHESGIWRPEAGREFRFRNVYRWSLAEHQAVRLEHLRYGPERPVHLFDLTAESEAAWVSITPHQCRDDRYSARLQREDWGITLRWAIVGPRNHESIEYRYIWRDES